MQYEHNDFVVQEQAMCYAHTLFVHNTVDVRYGVACKYQIQHMF